MTTIGSPAERGSLDRIAQRLRLDRHENDPRVCALTRVVEQRELPLQIVFARRPVIVNVQPATCSAGDRAGMGGIPQRNAGGDRDQRDLLRLTLASLQRPHQA